MTTAVALARRRRTVAAGRARRPRSRVAPPSQSPRGPVVAYTKVLLAITREIAEAVRAELRKLGIPVRRDAAADGAGPPLAPGDAARVTARLRALARRITSRQSLLAQLGTIAAATDDFSRAQFARQVRAVLGIDLADSVPGLRGMVSDFRTQNVSLIRALADDQVGKVRRALDDAGVGTRVEDLADRIQEDTGVSERKAALLARDQVLKLNANVTQARHEAAGITEYVWRTSEDERVRASHKALDGTRQSYASPPETEDGRRCHPGEDFQCRCTADPVIPALDDDAA